MKLSQLKTIVKDAVKEAIQEEMKDILIEAVRAPKQTVYENRMGTPTTDVAAPSPMNPVAQTPMSEDKRMVMKENIQNVELIPPVGRIELTKYYLEADILFLHLNNISAFKRVLPSKIFEYAALGKPIIAGLNGYSAKFMRKNIPYALIFPPGDSKSAVKCILDSNDVKVSRNIVTEFVSKYLRVTIMDNLTQELIGCIEDTK